jgi:hypothetical protein
MKHGDYLEIVSNYDSNISGPELIHPDAKIPRVPYSFGSVSSCRVCIAKQVESFGDQAGIKL